MNSEPFACSNLHTLSNVNGHNHYQSKENYTSLHYGIK